MSGSEHQEGDIREAQSLDGRPICTSSETSPYSVGNSTTVASSSVVLQHSRTQARITLSPFAVITDDSDEDGVIEIPRLPTPPPPPPMQLRRSARHADKELNMSSDSQRGKPPSKPSAPKSLPLKASKQTIQTLKLAANSPEVPISTGKTDFFVLLNRHLFLPLLPVNNYISKLQDKAQSEPTAQPQSQSHHVTQPLA